MSSFLQIVFAGHQACLQETPEDLMCFFEQNGSFLYLERAASLRMQLSLRLLTVNNGSKEGGPDKRKDRARVGYWVWMGTQGDWGKKISISPPTIFYTSDCVGCLQKSPWSYKKYKLLWCEAKKHLVFLSSFSLKKINNWTFFFRLYRYFTSPAFSVQTEERSRVPNFKASGSFKRKRFGFYVIT